MSEHVSVTSKFGGLDGTYSHKTSPSHPLGWKFAMLKLKKKRRRRRTELKTQVNVGPMGQPRLISLLSVSLCFNIKRETIDFTLLHYPEKKMRNNLTNNSE